MALGWHEDVADAHSRHSYLMPSAGMLLIVAVRGFSTRISRLVTRLRDEGNATCLSRDGSLTFARSRQGEDRRG